MATAIIAQVSSLNFPPLRPIHRKLNHEQFVNEIRNLIAGRQPAEIAERLRSVKLVYGCGDGSYRGICYYSAWKNGKPEPVDVVEIAASGEEHPVQLAGTCIHELGHVVAG